MILQKCVFVFVTRLRWYSGNRHGAFVSPATRRLGHTSMPSICIICICTCTWSLYLYLYLYLVTPPCLLQMLLFNRICTWEDIHAPRKNTLEINFVFLFFFRDLKRYAGEDSGSGKSGNSSGNMSKKVNSDLTCFTVLQISNKKQIFFCQS